MIILAEPPKHVAPVHSGTIHHVPHGTGATNSPGASSAVTARQHVASSPGASSAVSVRQHVTSSPGASSAVTATLHGISANSIAGSHRLPMHNPVPHHVVGSHRLPAHPEHHPHHVVGQHPPSHRVHVPTVTKVVVGHVPQGQPLAKRATPSTPCAPLQLQQDIERNASIPPTRSVRSVPSRVATASSVGTVITADGAEAAMLEKRDARIRELERELHQKNTMVREHEGEIADLRRQCQNLQHIGRSTSGILEVTEATQGHLRRRQDHECEAPWQMAKRQDHECEASPVRRRSQEQQPIAEQYPPLQARQSRGYHEQQQQQQQVRQQQSASAGDQGRSARPGTRSGSGHGQQGGGAQPGGRPFQPAARAPLDSAKIGDRARQPPSLLSQRDGGGRLGGSTLGSAMQSMQSLDEAGDEVGALSSQRCASLTDLDVSRSVASQSVASIGDLESDEVDERLYAYFEAHPDFQLEVTKVRRGWYWLGKPVGKKVHIKIIGKSAVLKVGGGYQALIAFLDEKRAAAASGIPPSRSRTGASGNARARGSA